MVKEELIREINRTMDSVNDSFVRGDVKTYVSHYHMPIIHADPQQGVMMWDDPDETEKTIAGMVRELKAEGWENSAIADRVISLMSENLALMQSIVYRYDGQGNPATRGTGKYTSSPPTPPATSPVDGIGATGRSPLLIVHLILWISLLGAGIPPSRLLLSSWLRSLLQWSSAAWS